jgi:hypothetical protein
MFATRMLSIAILTLALFASAPAAPPPQPQPDDREVHVIGICEGSTRTGDKIHGGKASVRVDRPGKQVTLVLAAYSSVTWDVSASEKTRLLKVILAGYHKQAASGLPKHVDVVDAYAEGREGQPAIPCAYDMKSARFRPMIQETHELTDREVVSFQGAYRGDPERPFVVDRVQTDPRLDSDFPKPEAAANLPKLDFQALHFVAGRFRGDAQATYGRFTLTGGPDLNSLRPLPRRINRLTADPATRKSYALSHHEVVEIDLNTNGVTKMDMGLDVPQLSWPCGIAFDTKRNRLVVASMGGVGYLYTFTPATGKWAAIADLNNVDLAALAYHVKDDALYGLSAGRDRNGEVSVPTLHRYNENGAKVSVTPLTGTVFPGLVSEHPSAAPAQLVAAGDHLILVATTEPDAGRGGIKPESFIYLVEPKTGRARLAWKQ